MAESPRHTIAHQPLLRWRGRAVRPLVRQMSALGHSGHRSGVRYVRRNSSGSFAMLTAIRRALADARVAPANNGRRLRGAANDAGQRQRRRGGGQRGDWCIYNPHKPGSPSHSHSCKPGSQGNRRAENKGLGHSRNWSHRVRLRPLLHRPTPIRPSSNPQHERDL
jgi:hypothetical protein